MPVPIMDPTPNAVRLSRPSDRRSVPFSASSRSSATDFFVRMDIGGILGEGIRDQGIRINAWIRVERARINSRKRRCAHANVATACATVVHARYGVCRNGVAALLGAV